VTFLFRVDKYAKLFAYNSWNDIKGKTLSDLYPHESYANFIDKLSILRKKVINEKRNITHGPFSN